MRVLNVDALGDCGKARVVWGEGRVVAVYFAASWCPACREFEPQLRSFYDEMKRTPRGDSFDMVFASWDEDERAYNEHKSNMPWRSLPFQGSNAEQGQERLGRQVHLARILRVRTIPTLVLLDGFDGRVITREGCHHVTQDPKGTKFPWRPRSLGSLLKQDKLVVAGGGTRDASELTGHITCLYFSANWCPPCKAFTPQLVDTYTRLKSRGIQFEVVFISSDRSQESFDHYFATMPWLAIPYAEEKKRKEAAQLLGVKGIPTLVVLDENDEVLTRDGRYEVVEDPDGNNFPWRPNLVQELTAKHSSRLNEDPFLIIFTDGNEKELEQAKAILLPVAQEMATKHLDRLWFYVGGETDICDLLREEALLEDEVPLLVILDTANKEKFVFEEDVELTEDIVRDFVLSYLNGELQPQPFREC